MKSEETGGGESGKWESEKAQTERVVVVFWGLISTRDEIPAVLV